VKSRAEGRGKWLHTGGYELGELLEIARAISTEREVDKLLHLILEKSRFITGADAGTLQSKRMSISDIFDALTASDRPDKRAVPLERALDILELEVKEQHLDADLVRIFTEAQVWNAVDEPSVAPRRN
jgi:hypothetical protein